MHKMKRLILYVLMFIGVKNTFSNSVIQLKMLLVVSKQGVFFTIKCER